MSLAARTKWITILITDDEIDGLPVPYNTVGCRLEMAYEDIVELPIEHVAKAFLAPAFLAAKAHLGPSFRR